MHTKTWHVTINLFEDGSNTRADAVLNTSAGAELHSSGTARRNPADRDVPEIGDELAACRALSGMARQLLDAALMDLEDNPSGHRAAAP